MTRRLLAVSGTVIAAALASGCGTETFPVTPTPVASSAVVEQGTKYQGNMLLSTGGTTSFNMTLIARELSGATRVTTRAAYTPAVTGSFETGSGLKGTVQGTLTGALDNGHFDGSLTASSAGCTSEQRYSGPFTTVSAALAPGECIQGTCAADGLTGAIQTVQTPTANGPPPPSCSYALSPATASFPVSGGTGSTTVTTSPNCAWAAIPTAPWIAIAGAAAGTGVGTVTFTVQANPGEQQRSGSLRIADQTLTVVEASGTAFSGPAITTQPQSQMIASGATATLSVTATGTAPLSYQWYVGPSGTTTNLIAGATAGSYTTPALTNTTTYWVRVTNAGGSVDSNTATITVGVDELPIITSQPQSQTIAPGATATLSVTATGTAPLSYQWYVGSSGTTTNPIGGATASSYTTPALTATTSYWVRVANSRGNANSNTATITVTSAPVTPPVVTAHPQSQTIASGATATLSVTATSTAPLSYQWYVGSSGTTTSPIAGATASSYTTGALTATTSYWVRVTNSGGSADSNTATITVTPPTVMPPVITTHPQSQTIASGATATMSVAATSTAPLSYQWYVGSSGTTTSPIGGATASSYTTPALTATTSYWVRVTNSGGFVNSNTATITVTPTVMPPVITTHPQSQTIASGATATMSVAATSTAPLSYQWYVGSSGTTTSPISGATASSYTTPALTATTSYWVRVTNSGGFVNSNTATITVTLSPRIVVTPLSGTRPVTFTVTGTGFTPNGMADVIVVRNPGGGIEHLVPSTVSGGGGFTATFRFETISVAGTFSVTATDRTTMVVSNAVTITLN